jgi:hypothetical protein
MHLPAPIAIDPRACEWCGLLIDRHLLVDNGDGPEFFCLDLCPDEMTLPELERRAELRFEEEVVAMVERMERADSRDRWRHTAEPPPPDSVRNGPSIQAPPREPAPYRPARSTGDEFAYLVATGDVGRLTAWLADHPKDAPLLLALLESPPSC